MTEAEVLGWRVDRRSRYGGSGLALVVAAIIPLTVETIPGTRPSERNDLELTRSIHLPESPGGSYTRRAPCRKPRRGRDVADGSIPTQHNYRRPGLSSTRNREDEACYLIDITRENNAHNQSAQRSAGRSC